ncbi:hypothetical protein [Streptococcus hyointestinalis]
MEFVLLYYKQGQFRDHRLARTSSGSAGICGKTARVLDHAYGIS